MEVPLGPLLTSPAEVFCLADEETTGEKARLEAMAPEALVCKECESRYPLEASYVCERCFGPLEVSYDFADLDPDEARRKIQAGSRGIWRYADFLPFAERPARSTRARADAPGTRRPPRRAPRARGAVGQERRRQPHPLVQGPRRRSRPGEGARARLRDRRLRLHRQPRQRRRRACSGRRALLLRVRARRPRGAEAARHGDLRDAAGRCSRHLRRRQPPLHRAV